MSWFAASGALLSASVRQKGALKRTEGRRFDVGAARTAAAAVTLASTLAARASDRWQGLDYVRASRTVSYGRSKHTTRRVYVPDVRPEP